MKFAVKALLMGLSVSAIKQQQNAHKSPYSSQLIKVENKNGYIGEYLNGEYLNSIEDSLLPDWEDYVEGVYVAPECRECEEKVEEECHDIHSAERAKVAAYEANAEANETADEVYEKKKDVAMAEVKAAEVHDHDERKAAEESVR